MPLQHLPGIRPPPNIRPPGRTIPDVRRPVLSDPDFTARRTGLTDNMGLHIPTLFTLGPTNIPFAHRRSYFGGQVLDRVTSSFFNSGNPTIIPPSNFPAASRGDPRCSFVYSEKHSPGCLEVAG